MVSFEQVGDISIPDDAREHCMIGSTRILAYIKDKAMDAICRPMVLPSKTCSNGQQIEDNQIPANMEDSGIRKLCNGNSRKSLFTMPN
jgi:hypothetical protein